MLSKEGITSLELQEREVEEEEKFNMKELMVFKEAKEGLNMKREKQMKGEYFEEELMVIKEEEEELMTEIKEEMMEREIKWGTMIPLVGGSALGCERAAGSLPQYHLSYSPFANNEAHLRSHWAEKQVCQKPNNFNEG